MSTENTAPADQAKPGEPQPYYHRDLGYSEFLAKRLTRVAKAVGHLMPSMDYEGIAEVAPTILGGIALKLEQAAKAPIGWAAVGSDGYVHDWRPRVQDHFGGELQLGPHEPEHLAHMDRDRPDATPHRTVPLYTAAIAAQQPLPCPEFYRHIKTGGIYEAICNANAEATGELLVVYRNTKTGERWARPAAEFNDGRFERITAVELAEVDALIDAAMQATGGASHG